MLYQTQQLDNESGLYHLRARQYDATTGRFISVDPVTGYLTIPQTQNPYAYAMNNPVNLSDPSGEIIPFLLAAWAIAEIALTASDAYDFANTLQNPNANVCDKAWSGALFAAGLVGPGGGYGKIDDAAGLLNKLNHIFGDSGHNLDNFLKNFGGDQEKAYNAVESAIQTLANQGKVSGQFNEVSVVVNGYTVTVSGKIIDGKTNIGTFFIR